MAATLTQEYRTSSSTLGGHDTGFVFALLGLMSIGVVMVYSSSVYVATYTLEL